jgi:CubicO group peptidase (beta-lactamase class C family)
MGNLFVSSVVLVLLTCQHSMSADLDSASIAARHYGELIRRKLVTGAAFAAVKHREVRETAFFGLAGQDSLWRAASTSKAFTAIGIMRLVERRQIELDADVNRYLKTFVSPQAGSTRSACATYSAIPPASTILSSEAAFLIQSDRNPR